MIGSTTMRLLSPVLVIVLSVSMIASTEASATTRSESKDDTYPSMPFIWPHDINPYHNSNINDIEDLLDTINAIPDEVLLQGDAALEAYIDQHDIMLQGGVADRDAWQVAKCSASIIWVIGSTIFVAAKILKIKALIKGLGGVKAAATIFVKAKSKSAVMSEVGSSLRGAAAEFLGLTLIKDNCFS